jgi:DNA polymerase III delta subunit
MTLAAAHALTSLTGNDLGAVDATLRNLTVAAGDRPEIDEDTVRELVGGGRDYGAFAFGEAVYTRDPAKALAIARNAFREGIEDQKGRRVRDAGYVAGRLLWSVGFRLKDVYRVSKVLAAGASDAEAEKASGKRGPIAKRLLRQAKGFTPEELIGHWVLLADAEADLRTPVPPPVIVERFVGTVTERSR